jgi:hypothetical protein
LSWRKACLSVLTILLVGTRSLAQDLEPRVYAASPVGTTFVGIGFGRSSGDVTFDPTIPITNVHAALYASALAISHTFPLLTRQTLLSMALPYVWGNVTGDERKQELFIDPAWAICGCAIQ